MHILSLFTGGYNIIYQVEFFHKEIILPYFPSYLLSFILVYLQTIITYYSFSLIRLFELCKKNFY